MQSNKSNQRKKMTNLHFLDLDNSKDLQTFNQLIDVEILHMRCQFEVNENECPMF